MALYVAYNASVPTTTALQKVATGTSIKTLLQIATPSTQDISIIEWGISFDGSALETPIECELFGTTVAATSGTSITPIGYDASGNNRLSLCVGGTGSTCYSPSTEGTVANARMFDAQLVEPIGGYIKQFPLGSQPYVAVSQYVRIRVTAGTGVNAYCYVVWQE